MNFFTKTRILIGIIIILSAIIIAMFGTMSYHKFESHRRSPRENRLPGDDRDTREEHQPGKYMAKQLQLTPEQVKEFDRLRDKFHDETDAIMKEGRDISNKVMEEIFSDNPNRAKLDSLSKKFGELQSKQKQLMYEHLLEIRSKCTDSQQANFKKLLKRIENHNRMYRERRPDTEDRNNN
jgi:Spy/CpxP family protein refolding chaperone